MTLTTRFSLMLGAALIATSGALGAQAVDARWQPWIGCWAPVAGDASPLRMLGATPRVCVTPAQGTSAVEIVTIAGGKVVDRARIEADFQPHQVARDGCTGTETAHWSEYGTRLYLSSALACTGGVSRRGTGVLSLTERFEWLDVRGVNSGKTTSLAVGRLTTADADSASIPAEVRNAMTVRTVTSSTTALAAAAALTLADIADVSTNVDSSVTSAWLMERTRGLKLSINGKQLTALADAGVPPTIIDFVVALAHPAVFGFDANVRAAGGTSGNQPLTGQNRGYSSYSYPYGYGYGSPLGYYGYSMYDSCYGYGSVSMLYGYGCSGYGYGRYGGYTPYYGPYYSGYYPPVIVVRPPDGTNAPSHGRVVNGQGYTSGGGSTGSSASPSKGLTSGGSSGSSSSGSSGSSGASSSSGSSGSSGGDGGGRTAVKKP